MYKLYLFLYLTIVFGSCSTNSSNNQSGSKQPVDYVNPYMGNISHLLVPTSPTIHMPNSMLRVYPERSDFTTDAIKGLPLIVTSHRGSSAFNLSPYQGDKSGIAPVIKFSYDNEKLTPYNYSVLLDDQQTQVEYALSHQSAIYNIEYKQVNSPVYLILNSKNGGMMVENNTISGFQRLANNTTVYGSTTRSPEVGYLGEWSYQ